MAFGERARDSSVARETGKACKGRLSNVCVCFCVCVRERERERGVYMNTRKYTCIHMWTHLDF
jgi:hypothetical protein